MTEAEKIGTFIAIGAVLAAYLPFVIGTGKRIKDIAMWRQSVDDSLDAQRSERLAGDKELGRRLDRIEASLDRQDEHMKDIGRGMQGLAEIAGRAIGRTEGTRDGS